MQETRIWSLGWEDPLEEEMATHPSTSAWKIQGQRGLEDYSPWACKKSDTAEPPSRSIHTSNPPTVRRQFLQVDLWVNGLTSHLSVSSCSLRTAVTRQLSALKDVSCGFPSGVVSATLTTVNSMNQGALTHLWMMTDSGFHGRPSHRRRASAFPVPGLSLEMFVFTGGDRELKDLGTLFSVPIISKKASRWSREIISLANYPNGWADRTLHSPMRAEGSWSPCQLWPNWLAATEPRTHRLPSLPLTRGFWGHSPSTVLEGSRRRLLFFLLQW